MQEEKSIICCRWSPTLGELETTHEEIWGTKNYNSETDKDLPCVFFGLYGLPDFYALWRHRGKKWILWTGSDIRHFQNGYWLEEGGNIRLTPHPLADWISVHCESWVENNIEWAVLKELGIESKICPSFLGKVDNYEVSYKQSDKPKVYTSVSGDDFGLYGWNKMPQLVKENPDTQFHFYGASSYVPVMGFQNTFIHGRIPKEQMNAEIREMQGALRLVRFEGFSEIIAKSFLWGQWPISAIDYPNVLRISEIRLLKGRTKPNFAGRNYYIKSLNQFPWNLKK